MKTVVIVGSANDSECQYVAAALSQLGARPLIFETANVPDRASLIWDRGTILYEGEALHDHTCFYLKSIHLSLPSHDPQQFSHRNVEIWQEQYIAERERHSFIVSVLRDLHAGGRVFVNPVQTFDIHFLKLHQLSQMARADIPVPASLATSDPDALQHFVADYGSVIYKPLSGGAMVKRLGPEDLTPERLELIRNAPVLFQQEVLGDEFRVYVLDGAPVAALQIPTEGLVDARIALDQATLATLPDEAWSIATKAAETVGVVFGAVDMRRTAEGAWYVLECNPTPAITFFDTEEGLIVGQLAHYLLEHA